MPGPIFAQLLLADEINRAPAKTQSALLEAMQERAVTLDGDAPRAAALFTVFATQNPIEHEGTYPLPEAQLDRFLFKIDVGYPSELEEDAILASVHQHAEKQRFHEIVFRLYVEQRDAQHRAVGGNQRQIDAQHLIQLAAGLLDDHFCELHDAGNHHDEGQRGEIG